MSDTFTWSKKHEVSNKAYHWHPVKLCGTEVVGPREIPLKMCIVTAARHRLERLVVVSPQTGPVLWTVVCVQVTVATGQVPHTRVAVSTNVMCVKYLKRSVCMKQILFKHVSLFKHKLQG